MVAVRLPSPKYDFAFRLLQNPPLSYPHLSSQNLQTQTHHISLHISSLHLSSPISPHPSPISLYVPPPDARSSPRLHSAPSSSSSAPRDVSLLQHQRRRLRLANFPARPQHIKAYAGARVIVQDVHEEKSGTEERMEFCPTCGTLLQLELAQGTQKCRFFCPTCPYICSIERKIKKKEHLVKKQVDAIFSGAEALKYAPKTKATCPHCNNGEAYFRQMQIRSADEPMTTFYKCANEHCSREWRED